MEPDPTQDTLPTPAVRPKAAPPSRLAHFIRSVPGAFLILFIGLGTILTLAAVAGYYTGSSDRERTAATAQAAELGRQYQLGLEDLSAGRPTLAIQRFEFILALDPNYPSVADRLAEARAQVPATSGPETGAAPTALPSPTPLITVGPETAKNLLDAAQAAFDQQKWDEALQKIGALRAIDPNYESAKVRDLQFQSYQNRGIASIKGDKMELGLSDMDLASKLGTLSTEAQQYQQWAEIYIAGVSYWGLNWARTVDTFQLLYTIAPYFHDTITRLHDARVSYGRQLDGQGQPCDAVKQYEEALKLQPDQTVQALHDAAANACQFGTPTPDATQLAATNAAVTSVPTNGVTATVTEAATATNAPAALAPSATPQPSATATTASTSTLTATTAASPTPTNTATTANTDTPTFTPTVTDTPTTGP